MSVTTASIKYGTYRFNPVPQIGFVSSGTPLGQNKSGPVGRDRVVTIVGKIIGTSFADIQSRVWALDAAFAQQDQLLVWNDGTVQRIAANAKVLSISNPYEWGTYEANYTIQLSYLPQDDTNTPPFTVSYGGYTFNPIPVFSRNMKVQRESIDSIRLANRWELSLSGFIQKQSMAANMTEYNLLLAALNAADGATFTYGNFTQAVKMVSFQIAPDTWQSRINYSITVQYTDNLLTGGIIVLSSQRSIGRFTQRNAKHYIPFLDGAQFQLLGQAGQTITATGYIIADTLADARTAANSEINNQFPAAPAGGAVVEEESSRITEKYTENRVDWNVSKFYTIAPLEGLVYGSG